MTATASTPGHTAAADIVRRTHRVTANTATTAATAARSEAAPPQRMPVAVTPQHVTARWVSLAARGERVPR